MPHADSDFIINARKFDGKIYRSWQAQLFKKTGDLFIFKGIFNDEISHPHLGIIRSGTVSYEYYWLNCWYNVFQFNEPEGDFRNYYCNINKPPIINDNTVDYIDLDIDVLIWKDYSFEILDVDEFIFNSEKYSYSSQLTFNINAGLKELLHKIEYKLFPFAEKI